MADIDGIKQSDIAEKLGLNLSTTKSRIQRARQMLREEFLTCCHLETDRKGNLIGFAVKESCKPLQELKKRQT
ncbi:sigma factor-like helix-turn-helix DNA-binding protein [Litoribacter populi]|uniref:sigma factor-like helix-turn-helix DNA-binding protein n=1 Tax=Litoribacter populi TaxID=2598460 RepID=UPI00163DB5F2|nr:sigma factor-like helix-turn-helix DNA-binding protein [Litoribacter populi]